MENTKPLNFETDVIERSHTVPVVVDFWAEWCAPCRQLGPIIEGLASKADGKWELVKVDTEEHPEVAETYYIQGIPAVKMFWQGQIIGEFTGALPRASIERWLSAYLPDERMDELAAILGKLENDPAAEKEVYAFLEKYPDIEEAKILLARRKVRTDSAEAARIVDALRRGAKYEPEADSIRSTHEWLSLSDDSGAPAILKMKAAAEAYAAADDDKTLELLIESITLDKAVHNQLARRAAVAVFQTLGQEHPLVQKYLRRFNMALY